MKAVNLLGTLKKEEQSNTETLSEFLGGHFKNNDIDYEIIKLVDYNILQGTYNDMGEGDEWPEILKKIISSEIIIFSTPVWWNNQSSEIQRVIERLDEIHDEIMEGKKSRLEGKAGGIVITGDSDGAQNIISNISNFYNAIGIVLPPFATLSVLWEGHKKGTIKPYDELMKKYRQDYDKTADKMVKQLISYSSE
jgi:multimeric flavodoxin WrbA